MCVNVLLGSDPRGLAATGYGRLEGARVRVRVCVCVGLCPVVFATASFLASHFPPE